MKKISILLLLLVGVFAFSACQATDLVAKVAVTSFDTMLKALPDKVSVDDAKGGWSINGPDGKERIILSKDFSSTQPDITVEFDAAPFIKAGLDASKLPTDKYTFDQSTGKITMPYEYGQEKFGAAAGNTAIDTFKEIVKTHRDLIGYHEKLDHYGIALGNGNMFEWAKDITTNDKDMVFVLNPQPLIDAGVDASKIEEWIFAKVEVKDKEGKKELVDKFLKPFNLK